jgi:hypothetical protein
MRKLGGEEGRCRCYERRRAKLQEIEASHTLGGREEMLAAVMLAAVIHRLIDDFTHGSISLYYELIKREPKTRPVNECRCDERLKTKAEESTRLAYTGWLGELEHLKIKTRLNRQEVCECDG